MKLEQLTVDGTKIQAQASGGSFRREPRLRERLEQAEAVVRKRNQESGDEPARNQRQAAQQRAARERQARLQQALEQVREIGRAKPASQRQPARASWSEPEARVMKQGQGGFAPAYNVQSVTDAAHKIVVDVEVTAQANDQHQLLPARARVEPLQPAAQLIVEGGYLTEHSIAEVSENGRRVDWTGAAAPGPART